MLLWAVRKGWLHWGLAFANSPEHYVSFLQGHLSICPPVWQALTLGSPARVWAEPLMA